MYGSYVLQIFGSKAWEPLPGNTGGGLPFLGLPLLPNDELQGLRGVLIVVAGMVVDFFGILMKQHEVAEVEDQRSAQRKLSQKAFT